MSVREGQLRKTSLFTTSLLHVVPDCKQQAGFSGTGFLQHVTSLQTCQYIKVYMHYRVISESQICRLIMYKNLKIIILEPFSLLSIENQSIHASNTPQPTHYLKNQYRPCSGLRYWLIANNYYNYYALAENNLHRNLIIFLP